MNLINTQEAWLTFIDKNMCIEFLSDPHIYGKTNCLPFGKYLLLPSPC